MVGTTRRHTERYARSEHCVPHTMPLPDTVFHTLRQFRTPCTSVHTSAGDDGQTWVGEPLRFVVEAHGQDLVAAYASFSTGHRVARA